MTSHARYRIGQEGLNGMEQFATTRLLHPFTQFTIVRVESDGDKATVLVRLASPPGNPGVGAHIVAGQMRGACSSTPTGSSCSGRGAYGGSTSSRTRASSRELQEAFGSVTTNRAPCPSLLSTVMVPPWASTNRFAMARPRPAPPCSLVRALSVR